MNDSLPFDCVLLPISSGKLLVSRNHAVFCRVPPGEAASVSAVIANQSPVTILSQTMREALKRHGFFQPPRQAKSDSPTVQLQITNACNLACSYCCTNSQKRRKQEVSFERMVDVIRQIPDALGVRTAVSILGGEPLLVPWALDLASEIVDLGLPLTIFTNGVPLANDLLAEKLARLVEKGVRVHVSLAGPTAVICNAISGNNRFEAALRGIHNLAAFGAQTTADVMLMPQNVDAVASELDQLRRQLPPNTPVTLGVLYMSGRETGQNLFASRSELDAALDRIAFEAGVLIPSSRTSPVTHRREGCSCALGQHVHVRSDGALFNCFKMEEKVGDLAAVGFAEAAKIIQLQPHRASDLSICADCPLNTLCGGGCRSENLLYTGNPDEPLCGPWRVRVLSELLAEDRVTAVEWTIPFLLQEARNRGIETPDNLPPKGISRHMIDV
jgi:radical SAM protein with 4Fe4S-binding SPASM domain